MTSIILPYNWRPRSYQMPYWAFTENGGKRAICIWHRRSGKDEVCLHRAAVAAFERPATYWHMLPEYSQGRKAIWTAVNPSTGLRRIDEAFPREIRETTNDQEMFIRFKSGATWQIVGSDRYDANVGSPPAGITFSEWALSDPSAWAYLAPIVVENNGWAFFITTSRGRNHAKSMFDMAKQTKGWFAQVLTVDDTKAIAKDVIEAQRAEYHGIFGEEAGDALIEQEYYCSFDVAVLGSFWGKELALAEREGRIGNVEIDASLPVHTAWDIGMDDPMAIWCFQIGHGYVNVVDYYENSGFGFDHYADWLIERRYFGTDFVPADIMVREPGAPKGRTRIDSLIMCGRETWPEEFRRTPKRIPDLDHMDGINAGRRTIPKARFDAKRCGKGLEALREYKAEWDPALRTFRKTPKHDWASHAASAWRTLSLAWREPIAPPKPEPMRGSQEMTMEEAWAKARPRIPEQMGY